ncbi:hypothetical protein T10_11005 [Trichinella papuae]|uniref:Uncharacterized protein n=1 Tax=Trichinella papuae TaxID=268474 RepID=A0A0V1M1U9_9BILA|nr:hypothetical protein T10_13493 [Trichinella papuae]KRZ73399.1 hypothetical protein T10_11005 [Trichinella papuae]
MTSDENENLYNHPLPDVFSCTSLGTTSMNCTGSDLTLLSKPLQQCFINVGFLTQAKPFRTCDAIFMCI